MSCVRHITVALAFVSMVGCVEGESDDFGFDEMEEEVDAEGGGLIFDPPPGGGVLAPPGPPAETATTLRFFQNANFSGTQVTQTFLAPSGSLERFSTVPWSQIGGALPGGALSVRMTCGTRSTRVLLYQVANNTTAFSQWSSTSAFSYLECAPNQMVQVALPAPNGAAVVKSAAVLMHPWGGYQYDIGFNDPFTAAWEEGLDAELPSGAERNGSPILTMGGPRNFSIRQNFWVNSPWCFERAGHFTLNVSLNGPGNVTVGVSDSYVDQADNPEPWDCWTPMKEAMADGATEAAQRLTADLPADLTGFALGQCKSQQYLSPITPKSFTIVSGGVTYPMSVCE